MRAIRSSCTTAAATAASAIAEAEQPKTLVDLAGEVLEHALHVAHDGEGPRASARIPEYLIVDSDNTLSRTY